MTTLHKAAQQALEALEEYQYRGAPFLACDGAVAALKAALTQQADKPQRPKCLEFALDFLGTPENGELLAYIEQLEVQRDALLEALKDATKTIEHLGYPLAAIERARVAIKAVEETK